MAKYLVIMESPAKVKTIKKFLGANYEVAASNGHVRDFPKSQFGLAADRDILRFVIMLHINAELALGKVTHMPVTGCYFIVRPQELLDRFDFGR